MTPAEQALQSWLDGLDRTANPYAKGTTCWEMWAEAYMRLCDEWMAKATES